MGSRRTQMPSSVALVGACMGLVSACSDGIRSAPEPWAGSGAPPLGAPNQLAGTPGPSSAMGTGDSSALEPSRDDEPATEGTASCGDATDAGESPLRRLSRLEYRLTLQQLFRLSQPPEASDVPPDAAHAGFSVYSDLQTLSAQHLRAYLGVTSQLANELLADPPRRAAVIGCELDRSTCLDSFVERFGRLAFRRTLTPREQERVTTAARSQGLDRDDQYRFALEALLLSPNFLYRVELGGDGEPGALPLNSYELASRLSFTLLGRGPSADLLDRAEAGALDSQEGLIEAADEMAAESGSVAFYRTFFEQWLGFETLVSPKDPPPDWNDDLLADMKAETAAVLERFAWGGGNFLNVLTTNETVVNPALAEFYGLPEPNSTGAVEIPAAHPRAQTGLLTHASLLSQKTDGDRIAMRGNWLRRTFLCRNLEIPEAIAAELGERLVGLTHTQIVQERNSDGACRGCHAAIDPIGVGFEGFDATGRFDPDFAVPDYGVPPALPDAPEPAFEGVAQLAAKLRDLPEVVQCITARTFLFAHGREPAPEDQCTIESARQTFVTSGHDYRALVRGLVSTPAFRMRRAPDAATNIGGSTP